MLYAAFEAGQPSPLPELPIQYADFAAWQRQWLQGEQLDRLRDYWVRQLAGVPPLELPARPSAPGIRTTRGDALLSTSRRRRARPCWNSAAGKVSRPS